MRNRKFWVFIIAIIAIVFLNFFNKDGSSSITTLAIALFTSNVIQKNEHFNTYKGEK